MKKMIIQPAVFFFFVATTVMAAKPAGDTVQVKLKSQSASVQIAGTSSFHNWKETSDKGTSEVSFTFNNDKIEGLSGLTFTVAVKSLKSDHAMMDNNTCKALNADKSPNITYVAGSAVVTPIDATTYIIKTTGRFIIAGSTPETEVLGTPKVNADKSITVSGSKRFKMTDYDVKPPTAMLGTIKTGDDLTISYNLKFVK